MLTEATGDVELVLWDGLGLVIVEFLWQETMMLGS
jgi:hypothetical protein